MGSRKFVTKEFGQGANTYLGRTGEVWFQEGTTTVRFGNDLTPGGLPLSGGGGSAGVATLCAPGSATVVFTASSSSVRSLRVTVQAIGYETGVVDFPDTHSAEVLAVKNLRTGLGEASVYGIVYTSVNPLVTFDAQITGDVLEIVATPTSGVNSVTVNSSAIEIEG